MPNESPKIVEEHLDISSLETWLWDAACAIRGATDAPKFKDFILPLIFYKRLSDVFDDEFARQIENFGNAETAHKIIEEDHSRALAQNRKGIVRFYIPRSYAWSAIRNHASDGKLGEFVTDAMREVARLNPALDGVLNIKDYNERQSGQRLLDDDRLAALIEVISRHRLGLKNAEPDVLGRAYEYLLRKFAEGQGQSAGEFYTPKEVGILMARLLDPKPQTTIYDPTYVRESFTNIQPMIENLWVDIKESRRNYFLLDGQLANIVSNFDVDKRRSLFVRFLLVAESLQARRMLNKVGCHFMFIGMTKSRASRSR